jgi:hypothetical protein
MLLVQSLKWHNLGSRDSYEYDFSNNRNPHHWRQWASRHLSTCRLRVTKLGNGNEWNNPLWYQLKDQGGDRRGGVNGSQIIFFSGIGLCPKIKIPCNLSAIRWWKHFPIAKTWSQQNYKSIRRRMGSIGLTISKLRSKQWSNVATENVQQTCLIHSENFPKFKSFFTTLIPELWGIKLDKI